MSRQALSFEEIVALLDVYFDVEFSYIKSEVPAELIVSQPRGQQDFILNLTRRIAATNAELAFQFATSSVTALQAMDQHMVALLPDANPSFNDGRNLLVTPPQDEIVTGEVDTVGGDFELKEQQGLGHALGQVFSE